MSMNSLRLFSLLLVLSACQKEELITINPENISEQVDILGDANRGKSVYMFSKDTEGKTCMQCHFSDDGYDLAVFTKTIDFENQVFDRAFQHVSEQDALDVTAYIKSLRDTYTDRLDNVVFQPGNSTVSEYVFSQSFDFDNLSVSEINSWDFKHIKVPFQLPLWMIDGSNRDWMPDEPIQLLLNNNSACEAAYQNYLSHPSDQNWVRMKRVFWNQLTEGQIHPGEHGEHDFQESFNTMRWLSISYMQHVMLHRNKEWGTFDIVVDGVESDGNIESVLDPVWFVGNTVRRSRDNGDETTQIDNLIENGAEWMYMGFIGNYGKTTTFESKYLLNELDNYGFKYVATVSGLKMIVNRPNNTMAVYEDIESLVTHSHPSILNKVSSFSLDYVLDRLQNNYQEMVIYDGQTRVWTLESLNRAKTKLQTTSDVNKINQIISYIEAM